MGSPTLVSGRFPAAAAADAGPVAPPRRRRAWRDVTVGRLPAYALLIPTAVDVPDVRALVVESGEGLGPFNARGIGEPPIGPPAAALANAIEDATGVRITGLPITAERVARALGLIG